MKRTLSLIFLLCTIISTSANASTILSENEVSIEPRASYVFDVTASAISRSSYGGHASLTDRGSGTITITLQKYASASNSWVALDGPYSKSFSGTSIPAYTKSRILSTKGKYRCKTTVKATVGSHTDTRTVYSGTLTIN